MDIEAEVKPAPTPAPALVPTAAPATALEPATADGATPEVTPESAAAPDTPAVPVVEKIVYVEKVVDRLIEIPAKPLSAVVGALAAMLASQPTGCSVPELCSMVQKLNLSISESDVCVVCRPSEAPC